MPHHRQGRLLWTGKWEFKWSLICLKCHPSEGKRSKETYQGLWFPELPILQVSSKSPTNTEQEISTNWQPGHQHNNFPQVAHWTHLFICEISQVWGKYNPNSCSSPSAALSSELRNHTYLRTLVMLHTGGVCGIQWKFTCLNLNLEGHLLKFNSLPTPLKIFV